MSPIDMLQAAQAVWDGVGVALAVATPIMIGGGLFRVLQSVWRGE